MSEIKRSSLGFFGNIWVHQNHLDKTGDRNGGGHYHKFDHISLLVKGSVRVEIENKEPKDFIAPTFIVVRKDQKHKFTALEDDTVYYCVFALRDINGEVITDEDVNVFGVEHDPLCSSIVLDGYHDKVAKLAEATQHEVDDASSNSLS